MSDSKQIILCVTEGAKSEVSFIEKYLIPLYFSHPNIEIVSFKANIYQLYQELYADEFVDVYSLLQSLPRTKTLDFKRDDISEIYLFFDLDAHATQVKDIIPKGVDCIDDMLQLFDNETENGKLYISYPMFEAYKHPISEINVVDIFIDGGYKKYVAKHCNKKLEQLHKLSKTEWNQLLLQHFQNVTDFLEKTELTFSTDDFTQQMIYQKQLIKHITPASQVRVISPFVLFLLDYLGVSLLEKLKT